MPPGRRDIHRWWSRWRRPRSWSIGDGGSTGWAASGDWHEAQVDFRKALELSRLKNVPENPSLKKLINSKNPPKQLVLRFSGIGPTTEWENSRYQPTFIEQPTAPSKESISFPTHPWVLRHKLRNSELRDVISNSNYMAQFMGVKTGSTAELAIGKTVTGAMKVGAVVVGVALTGGALYLISLAPSAGEGAAYILLSGFLNILFG